MFAVRVMSPVLIVALMFWQIIAIEFESKTSTQNRIRGYFKAFGQYIKDNPQFHVEFIRYQQKELFGETKFESGFVRQQSSFSLHPSESLNHRLAKMPSTLRERKTKLDETNDIIVNDPEFLQYLYENEIEYQQKHQDFEGN